MKQTPGDNGLRAAADNLTRVMAEHVPAASRERARTVMHELVNTGEEPAMADDKPKDANDKPKGDAIRPPGGMVITEADASADQAAHRLGEALKLMDPKGKGK